MTGTSAVAAAADEEPRSRQARCQPHLARLAWFVADWADAPLPAGAADEVAEATTAVLAQAEAARRAMTAGTAAGSESSEFLTVRLARLQDAAREAVDAASRGDHLFLRASLRRFHTLTAALWTVHQAIAVPAPTQEDLPVARRHPSAP